MNHMFNPAKARGKVHGVDESEKDSTTLQRTHTALCRSYSLLHSILILGGSQVVRSERVHFEC